MIIARLGLAFVAVTAAAACAADNPFDPATPSDRQQPAKIHGAVTDSAGPVKGANVAIGTKKTVSGLDGSYTLEGIVPGVATLVVTQPAHVDFTRDLVLLAGDDRTVDVTMTSENAAEGGHIQGIARKGTEVGNADPDFSGIVVEIESASVRTVTNTAGNYDILIAPGTYDLTFSAHDNITQQKTGVVVAAGALVPLDVVTLAANPGSMKGTVTLESEVPGAASHGGVIVTVGPATTTTGSDDTYTLTGLAPGTRTALFTKTGYEQVERTVEIVAGVALDVEDVQMVLARGSVAGFVSLSGFADSSGVTITLHGTAGTFAGVSAPDGSFAVPSLPSGVYDVDATRSGFVPASGGTITVVGDTTVLLNDAQHPLVLSAQVGDFLVDGGAPFTNDPVVTLTIDPLGTQPAQMVLSESSTFTGATATDFAANPTFTLSSGDGAHTIFLQLIDNAGNPSGPFQASIVLDTLPPSSPSITVDGGAAFSNNVDGFVALTPFAADDGSGIGEMQIALDGDGAAPFVPFSTALVFPIAPNSDGLHTFAAVFRDRAGNESLPVTSSITLDRTAPVVGQIVISADATGTASAFSHSPAVQVFITPAVGNDDVVAMALSTDPLFPSTVFQAFASPASILLAPGDGVRTVSVKLKDAAGNISPALTDSIVVDTSAPSAASVLLAGGAAVTRAHVVAIDIAAVGATLVRASLTGTFAADGSDFVDVASFPSTFDLGTVDGTKTVFAQFADDAGNVSDVVSDSIVLDTVAPVLGSAPILVNGGGAFSSSVSVTVEFDVAGASQVAVAIDGTVDSESFQPFSQFLTVLLPSVQCTAGNLDCRTVCAIFKDDAGNATPQVCDGITLDTTVPSAPLIVENDSVVASAAFTLHLIDASPDAFFDHFEILIDPGQPSFTRVNPGASSGGQLPFTLTLTAPATNDPLLAAQPNIVRVRAVDKAGNISPESAVTVVVDNVAPSTPLLANPPGAATFGQTGVTSASTLSVNFLTGQNLADQDATFDHYKVFTSLLPQPFDSFQRDGIVVELLPDRLNTISVVAVDAAGNQSAAGTIRVRQDDVAPFSPSITPTEAFARGGPVEISLLTPSLDPAPADAPPGTQPSPVSRYQLRDGLGAGFKDVPGTGPFLAFLRPNFDNEICVRGVDAAGNIGIEECAVVHEVTKREIASNSDHPHGSDLFGDVLVFGGAGKVIMRDVSGGFPDTALVNGGTDNEFSTQTDLHLGGDGDHVFAVWQAGFDPVNGQPDSAIFQLDFSTLQANGAPTVTKGLFDGTAPSVDGNTIVYFNGGRVRQRTTTVPPDFNPVTTRIDPNPGDAGTDISGAVTLCAGTEPRVAAGVVVWCQEPNHQLMRHLVADGGSLANNKLLASNLDVARQGSLVNDGLNRIQQPVVSANAIAWESADPSAGFGVGLLFIDVSANAAATGPIVKAGSVVEDSIEDLDGFIITSVNISSIGLTNDVVATLLSATPVVVGGTNDVSPQGDSSADAGRLSFEDTATGETLELIDLSTTRWLTPPALAFEPVTSTAATVWIQGVNNNSRIGLAARLLPMDTHAVQVVDDATTQFSFSGPAHADPAFGVGGTRVAWASANAGGGFSIFVRDLTNNNPPSLVTASGSVVLAIDPDGDDLVFVNGAGAVQEVALPATLPATFTPTTVTLAAGSAGALAPIFLDVDNGMIVAQRGGIADRDGDITGTGDLVCAQGGASGVIPTGAGRGPKVAQTSPGRFLFTATDTSSRAHGCFLSCSSTPTCVPFTAGANAGRDTHVSVSRSGFITFLNDSTSLAQVVSFDALAKRRVHLTSGDFERTAVTVAGKRVTYTDDSLGGASIFEINLP